MFDAAVAAGVLRIRRPDARWLSTGWDGGFHDTDVAAGPTSRIRDRRS
jgi:adenosylcobinamide hydrolase